MWCGGGGLMCSLGARTAGTDGLCCTCYSLQAVGQLTFDNI